MQPFQYVSAGSVEEAIAAAQGKAMIMAGGTDILGMLKNRVLPLYPEILINIKSIPDLDYLEESAEVLRIGALAKLADIAASPLVRQKYGILAEAADAVGSPQLRHMGTLGGNLCQKVRCLYFRCSPLSGLDYYCRRKGGKSCFAVAGDNRYHAILGGKGCFAVCPSDLAVALCALDAKVKLQGKTGERLIPLADFYTTLGNVLDPQEMVTGIQVPRPPPGSRQRFLKFRLRKAIDFAIASVASITLVEEGICRETRLFLGAVAPTPIRAVAAEETLKGKVLDAATVEEAARAALAGASPLSMNAYKIEVTKALIKKAISG